MKTFLSLITRFLHETPGSAGSGGGSTGQQGTGQPAPAGGGSGGAGGGSFTKFDPNASYDFGDGKPVKGSDYLAGFMPKSQFESGREFLMKEAQRLETLYGKLIPNQRPPQNQPPPQNQKRPNPMDRFANQPVIDGRTLSDAYLAMQEGDIQPMTQALTQIAQVVKQQQDTINKLQKGYGSINEQTRTQDYGRKLSSGVEGLGYSPEVIKQHPILRELAEDVYLSHDPNDPNLDKEFGPLLKSRIDSMIKLVRALDKQKMDEAKTMRRTFTRPGGNAQPGQSSRYAHENGSTLARRLFGEVTPT